MLPIHLGLVSLVPSIDLAEVSIVSAAVQKQIVRDFGPLWDIEATIDAFATLDDVPVDYWKILIVDTVTEGGQHRERHRQPYALVAAGPSWSLVASHEALEMLADPSGNRLVAGASPIAAQGRVEFLVEVCDPCQSDEYAYTVNGILVSDFYTPNYFDPVQATGVRYSFNGGIQAPRQVLRDGYLSWREPISADWFQQRDVGGQLQLKQLGQIAPGNNSNRFAIDRLTPSTRALSNVPADKPSMQYASRARAAAQKAALAQAEELRDLIASEKKP